MAHNDFVIDPSRIKEAVEILQSIGVRNLCHPYTDVYSPILSVCDDHRGLITYDPIYTERHLLDETTQAVRQFYLVHVIGTIVSVGFVALTAGLFLGLLTLDALDLQIIERSTIDDDERRFAANLFPIVKQRHRLLVTLLILSSLAYETLPIFLDALVPSWVAVLLSTTLIMIFGEVIPSALFTGPNQLYLGNLMAPLVLFFMFILYPVAMPLGALLDSMVDKGEKAGTEAYNRGELSALVRIQYEERVARRTSVLRKDRKQRVQQQRQKWGALKMEIIQAVNDREENHQHNSDRGQNQHHEERQGHGFLRFGSIDEEAGAAVEQLTPPLHQTEVGVVEGALQMKTNVAMDVFTPLREIYSVPDDLILDRTAISRIYGEGYSRVPVYEHNPNGRNDRTRVLGFLMTRQLMLIDWEHRRKVSTLPLQRPDCVSPRMNLVDLLHVLRMGSLMAFVCARPDLANKALAAESAVPPEAGFMGIVTLEDVMESIIQERIYDERDIRARDRAIATLNRWAATKLQSFLRKKIRHRKARTNQENPKHSKDYREESVTEESITTPLLNGSDGVGYETV